jgi:predicted transcriptional regulator
MQCVSAISIPRILMVEQNENRLKICADFLQQSEADDNFNKIIMGANICLQV